MFYSVQLLGKTSPLGKLWLAAHADKRLKRQDINSTDVPQSVEQIIHSEDSEDQVPLALRLSGLLLLGLVKIYSRQLQYLQEDCLTAVQELDKADKVAGLWKGQNKQQKKNARTTIANQADVTVPDEPHQLFRFSSLSDEEGFGLFEENHAGLAMAAEAHASFMDLEFSLSQSDAHEDSAMVHLDEPEQLRAVPVDFDNDVEPALPFGDELPRMTPTKRLGRSASRDRSPEAMDADKPESGPLAPDALPEDANDDMLAAPLPMDDLPDLPSIVRPSAVAASDEAPQNDAQPAPEAGGAPNDREDEVMNDEQGCQPEIDDIPDDAHDSAPVPEPDAQPDPLPDVVTDVDAVPLDVQMEDAPGLSVSTDRLVSSFNVGVRMAICLSAQGMLAEISTGVEHNNAMPLQNQADLAAAIDTTNDDACVNGGQQADNALRSPKRRQVKRNKPEPVSDAPKQTRKRSAPKPRTDADKQSTTVASDETRELLKNRTSLICKLPPIVSKTRLRSRQLNTDDLDILLLPSALQEASLDQRMVRLFEAMGSCRPLSLPALRGDDDPGRDDEIEDAVPAPEPSGSRPNVLSSDAADHVEVLRNARPSVSGSHGVPPAGHPEHLLEADEREELQGDADGNMQIDDAADMDLPAVDMPPADETDPLMPAPDMQSMDMPPPPEFPSPGMPPLDVPQPDIPPTDPPSEMQHGGEGQGVAEPRPFEPTPPVGPSGLQTHSTDALHEHTPVETLYSAPGTQGTGGAEDSSLNAHTLHTLGRLEILTQSLPDSRKRKQPQAITMAQLVQSTDRPEAAKLFYDVLVLQAKGIVRIQEQQSPYSELQMVLNADQVYN